ncbi:cytochrome c [Devosia sp. Root413D1]|uniref:c-type cytochrome n=1 Tax=Devosia sp. Root413D1 TaxID=1736531 RepID=UPI000AA1CA21|nr:cytochrome c [Devosia sp. Root413D1]
MRHWVWMLLVAVLLGAGIAVYMLKPVQGAARDLALTGDVTRGQYLLRLGDCITCHTDKKNGIAELGGGPGLVTPFGTFYAPNITSDPKAGIGGWTLAQFSKAISDGEGPAGHLYPAFPYENYTLMSDQDVADLYAALQQVPPVSTSAKPHEVAFPFDMRPLVAGWKNLFFTPRRYEADASHSERWNRGRYLVEGPGHCVMCHSPRNLLGAVEKGKELTGNPAGGTGGRAPALTAERLKTEGYDVASIASALSDGFTPEFNVLGSAMGEVIADGTSFWTEADREAVGAYLLGEE